MPYMPEGMSLPATGDVDIKGFWEHAKQHELVMQRCTDCGTFRHPPMPVCYKCQSFNFEWHKLSGKGIIYSYMICHRPAVPALKERIPYNVVMVELPDADNVRMMGNLIDIPNEKIQIGMPVEVAFEDVTDDVALPQWKLASK